jgi:hypothetical protein
VTIFDYLKDIVVSKKGNLPLEQYVPYLVTRWLSFMNPTVAESLNIINTKTLLENKELHYKTMISLFPKMKYMPRINYVKKVKEEETEESKLVSLLAQNLELSKRDVGYLVS